MWRCFSCWKKTEQHLPFLGGIIFFFWPSKATHEEQWWLSVDFLGPPGVSWDVCHVCKVISLLMEGVKSTAALTPAGPIARRSRSECGLVASSLCVKEVLWVKMVLPKPGWYFWINLYIKNPSETEGSVLEVWGLNFMVRYTCVLIKIVLK